MKTCMKYSIYCVALFQIFFITPTFLFIGKFLEILGIGQHKEDTSVSKYYNMSSEVQIIAMYLYPCSIIQSINEVIKTYSYSQGIEDSFGWFYLFSSIACAPLCWYGIVKQGQGLKGFVAYKYAIEIMNLAFCLYVYKYKLDPKTKGIFSFSELKLVNALEEKILTPPDREEFKKNHRNLNSQETNLDTEVYSTDELTFKSYMWTCVKFALTLYMEFLSFEVGMIMCSIS